MSNKYFVHSFLMKAKKLESEEVIAVYMPSEISSYWEKVISVDRAFGFKIATFRDYHFHHHKDVICMSMDDKALMGKEPWLLLDPHIDYENSVYTANFLLNRYQRFLHKRIEIAKQYEKTKKYETLLQYEPHLVSAKIKPLLQNVSLSKLLLLENYKQYLSSWIFFDFMRRKDSYLENNNTTVLLQARNSENYWSFPEEWGICVKDSEYVLMSKDFLVNNKRTSYAYTLNFERRESDLLIDISTSTKPWLMTPLINPVTGFINIPKGNKTRSLYIWNEETSRIQQLKLRISPGYGGMYATSSNIYTQELGGELPNINQICKDPSIHNGKYFISTVPQNSNDRVKPAQRGLHYNDKYYLVKNFSEILNYLELYHSKPELIKSGLSSSLKGGSVFIDDPLESRDNEEIVLTYATTINSSIFEERFEKALRSFVVKETISNGETKPNSYNNHARYKMENIGGGVFQFYDRKRMMEKAFYVRLVNASKYMYLMRGLDTSVDLPEDAFYKRMELIKNEFLREEQIKLQSPGLAILELENLKGEVNDNKVATERGMLELGWLTQCFHKKDMTDKELENKLSSCIADLFIRKGFVNQMIEECKKVSQPFVCYFPFKEPVTLISGEEGYIFTVFRVENGIVQVKYSTISENWMCIDDAILKLKESERHNVFTSKHNDYEFSSMILKECKEQNAVVIFQEKQMPSFLKKMKRVPFRVATYLVSDNLPHITNLNKDNMASSGAFMIESKGECLSVPPKSSKIQIIQSQSKQTNNKPFSVRATARYKTNDMNRENRWIIYSAIHAMRFISLTYDGFINMPLPAHLYEKHFKRYLKDISLQSKKNKDYEKIIKV
ncbi:MULTISPECIES: hypothetical protein [Bacillus cereus group]|uniref:DUF3893 domain-containing protein n=1 Tax=Bacillus thuringiensis TaxID=1428 RepID=A0AAW4I2R1_BACTU|nr:MULTISPECIES: hypothetical protein [Bacillus cereus group]MBN9901377.1 hypothetical protein [Bacillus thuringiensis]MDY7519375.1 hypothetical protein [Bacillus thuringiensis]PFR36782.1 hypothetical protein COK20_17625 [Bacillus cereus]PFW21483.1 hypothetical protein COL07_29300 [Bacillus cereus]